MTLFHILLNIGSFRNVTSARGTEKGFVNRNKIGFIAHLVINDNHHSARFINYYI